MLEKKSKKQEEMTIACFIAGSVFVTSTRISSTIHGNSFRGNVAMICIIEVSLFWCEIDRSKKHRADVKISCNVDEFDDTEWKRFAQS